MVRWAGFVLILVVLPFSRDLASLGTRQFPCMPGERSGSLPFLWSSLFGSGVFRGKPETCPSFPCVEVDKGRLFVDCFSAFFW